MYSVYLHNEGEPDVCIYLDYHKATGFIDAKQKLDLIDPELVMEHNAAGTFDFKIPPTNPGYDKIRYFTTLVYVKRVSDNEPERYENIIWSGRVISESMDFHKNKAITCEGDLAFLNDTIQPQVEFKDTSVYNYLRAIIDVHNSKMPDHLKFKIGYVTVSDQNATKYTDFDSTFDCISDRLIDNLGGHIFVKFNSSGERTLNYFQEWPGDGDAVLRFGENLLDFTKNWDISELATAVLPVGDADTSREAIGELTPHITIESVNGGSMFIGNPEAIALYGRIEKVVNFNAETPQELYNLALDYVNSMQFDGITIEASAVDLGLYGLTNVAPIELLSRVRIVSPVHGLDANFRVTKLTIPLDNPANVEYEFVKEVVQGSGSPVRPAKKSENTLTKNVIASSKNAKNQWTNGFKAINELLKKGV